MGLRQEIQQVVQDMDRVAYRPAQIYSNVAPGTYNLWTVTGGPIWVKAIGTRAVQAVTTAPTFALTLNTVAMQNAAVAVTCVINGITTFPLGAAAGQVIVTNLLSQPPYSLANALLGQVGQGQIMGTGIILLTVGAAVADGTIEFFMVYKKLSPVSIVA